MNTKRILTAIAILLLFPVVAFAQISVSSTPTTTVISTGRAEVAGPIVFTAGPSGAVSDTITINYNSLPITNITDGKTGITVTGTGAWAGKPHFIVDNEKGKVEVRTGGPGGVTEGIPDKITVSGVRVSVDGSALSSVKATISTVANPIFVGGAAGTEVTVISALADGIASVTSKTKTVILGTTGTTIAGATGAITVNEGFKGAFKTNTVAQAGAGKTQGTEIRVTATGLPSKAKIKNITVSSDRSGTTVDIKSGANTTLEPPKTDDKTKNQTTLEFTTSDLTKVDTLTVTYEVDVSGSTKPLAAGDITLTFTLAPIEAVDTEDLSENTKQPKFAQSDLSAAAGVVAPGTTNLYLSLVTWVAGFDTGFQISNTTADPFASGESAVKQSGTITFHFFPNDGTASFSYTTTAGSPGSGLGTDGKLAAGGTYTVLASEVLKAAGRTTSFTGYGIAVTQFTHAHGNTFVSDFKVFTQGVPALVIPPTAVKSRALQEVEQLTP